MGAPLALTADRDWEATMRNRSFASISNSRPSPFVLAIGGFTVAAVSVALVLCAAGCSSGTSDNGSGDDGGTSSGSSGGSGSGGGSGSSSGTGVAGSGSGGGSGSSSGSGGGTTSSSSGGGSGSSSGGTADDAGAGADANDMVCDIMPTDDGCWTCCENNHPSGSTTYENAFYDCVCGPPVGTNGVCQTQCASTDCSNNDDSGAPQPGDPCDTCESNATNPDGGCASALATACTTPDCLAFSNCVNNCQN
jgi:hypothetical protein